MQFYKIKFKLKTEMIYTTEVYSEPYQNSEMELFMKIDKSF